MDSMRLIQIHLELECIGYDAECQLYPIPCANPDTFLRVYVARHDQGDTVFFSQNLPQPIRQKLKRLPILDYFENPNRVKTILQEDGPCEEIHIGKSYIFPDNLSPRNFPDVTRLSHLAPEIVRHYNPELDLSSREVFGLLVDGQIVSTCESSREDRQAGEAWVQTHPDHRRRGYGRQVAAAWAYDLQQRGKIPFYSHKWENLASQAVAQSLGLIQYIADAGYE